MTQIIDIHTHLGDVLYPNGGGLIGRKNVRKKWYLDSLLLAELFLWGPVPIPNELVVLSGLVRNASATHENLRKAMAAAGVSKCITLAVPPSVTFDDLHAVYAQDEDIMPFTGVDYDQIEDIDATFAEQVARGAKGLKLHPILQRKSLNSPETMQAVEAFAPYGLPILFHAGESDYYLRPSEQHMARPELGNIDDAVELIKNFPQVKFIVGHSGLHRAGEVIEHFASSPNVYAELSFQSVKSVQHLIEAFTVERVLYGSDWPWGRMQPAIKIIRKACEGDLEAEKQILHDNAAELLQLSPMKV